VKELLVRGIGKMIPLG